MRATLLVLALSLVACAKSGEPTIFVSEEAMFRSAAGAWCDERGGEVAPIDLRLKAAAECAASESAHCWIEVPGSPRYIVTQNGSFLPVPETFEAPAACVAW